jgi:hypothetical protein
MLIHDNLASRLLHAHVLLVVLHVQHITGRPDPTCAHISCKHRTWPRPALLPHCISCKAHAADSWLHVPAHADLPLLLLTWHPNTCATPREPVLLLHVLHLHVGVCIHAHAR